MSFPVAERVAVIIPTLNAGSNFSNILQAISCQSIQFQRKIVIDSQSSDETRTIAEASGFDVVIVKKQEFNHGATRQMAINLLQQQSAELPDIALFCTQDAMLAHKDAVQNLVSVFADKSIAVAYGRQIPYPEAGPFAVHARLFNYPAVSRINRLADKQTKGIKVAFNSNSFSAYRLSALQQIGGFPKVILGEDMCVAARLLINGWKTAYCADALVYHSHDYSITDEVHRYFDTGVFHSQENWLLCTLGKAEGEGVRFVLSEIKYLWRSGYKKYIGNALLRTVCKYLGYKLGRMEKRLPVKLKAKLSLTKSYWVE